MLPPSSQWLNLAHVDATVFEEQGAGHLYRKVEQRDCGQSKLQVLKRG